MKKRMILRSALCALLVCALLSGAALPSFAMKAGGLTISDESFYIVLYSNLVRRDKGLPPLTVIPALQSVADLRAGELVQEFSHDRPDGRSYSTAYPKSLKWNYISENIEEAYNSELTPKEIVQNWVDSPPHLKNLLSKQADHVAVGGTGGVERFWSQNFLGHDCSYTSLEIAVGPKDAHVGDSAEDLRILARLNCSVHGESYLPVSADMIRGYDPDLESKEQKPTVTAFGLTTDFKVSLAPAEEEEPIPEGQGKLMFILPGAAVYALMKGPSSGRKIYHANGSRVDEEEIAASGMIAVTANREKYVFVVPGDTDGDSEITAGDARIALRIALELEDAGFWRGFAAKVNGYSEPDVTASDARTILRGAVGLEDPKVWYDNI